MLVVFCHKVVLPNESVLGNICMTFTCAAVPCFFMVTGSLMHYSKEFSWKKWELRVGKVYITYVIWKFLNLLFFMTINEVTFDVSTLISNLFFEGEMVGIDIGRLWFMSAYLQILLFYPISYWAHQNKMLFLYLYIIIFSASIGARVMNFIGLDIMNGVWTLIPFGGYINMLSYFILGSLLFDNREKIKEFLVEKKLDKVLPIGLIAVSLIILLCIKFIYTRSFQWNGVYIPEGYMRLSTMMMAIVFYLGFSMEIAPKFTGLFNFLGQNTMGIYYLHYPMLSALHKLCDAFFPNYTEKFSFALHVTQTIFVVLLCTLITLYAKKVPLMKRLFS